MRVICAIWIVWGVIVIGCLLWAQQSRTFVASAVGKSMHQLGPDNLTILITTVVSMVGTVLVGWWARHPASKVYDDLNNKHAGTPGTGEIIRAIATSIEAIRSNQSTQQMLLETQSAKIDDVAEVAKENRKRMDLLCAKEAECKQPKG